MRLWPARPREELKKKDCFQSSNENVRERYLGNVGSFWATPSAESNVRERSRYSNKVSVAGPFLMPFLAVFAIFLTSKGHFLSI